MSESPTTSFSLLARIRDLGDGAAWAEFVEVYAPLVYGLARKRQPQGSGDTDVQQVLEEQPMHEDVALWDEECRQRLFTWAADKVRGNFRPATWKAFWQTTVEGCNPKEVGEALGMSLGAVYIAKSRVLAAIKAHLRRLPGD